MEGNQMKMREVLVAVKKSIDDIGKSSIDCDPTILMAALTQVCARLSARIKRALAAPPRQCDVGTAEEQTKRFSDFCAAHRHTDLPRCAGCPLENIPSDTGCSFAWAQTPYEAEEGAGDGR